LTPSHITDADIEALRQISRASLAFRISA